MPLGLAREIGDVTARISTGLRGFFHAAAGRTHAWDIRRVADLSVHLDALPDDAARALVEQVLGTIAPTLAGVGELPAQVEHADVTLTNVLVERRPADRGHRFRRHAPHRNRLRPRGQL